MRSNGKIVALAVVLAALTIGVGYAAISTINLTISGQAAATANQGNFKVEFFGEPTTSGKGTTTATINGSDKTKATIDVSGLTAKGDIAIATYTVKNLSADLTANVTATSSVTGENSNYFSVTPTVQTADVLHDGTTTVTVQIELLKTPVEVEPEATVNVSIAAKPVQPQ